MRLIIRVKNLNIFHRQIVRANHTIFQKKLTFSSTEYTFKHLEIFPIFDYQFDPDRFGQT